MPSREWLDASWSTVESQQVPYLSHEAASLHLRQVVESGVAASKIVKYRQRVRGWERDEDLPEFALLRWFGVLRLINRRVNDARSAGRQ